MRALKLHADALTDGVLSALPLRVRVEPDAWDAAAADNSSDEDYLPSDGEPDDE